MTTSGQRCKYLVSNINIYLVEPVFCMKKILVLIAAIIVTSWLFAMPQDNKTALEVSPTDTINVVCYDLILNTDYIGLFGMTYIYANNEDYKLTGAIFADSVPPGTYTECVMDLTHLATSKKIPAASVTLTLAVDANKICAITGTMLGEDTILYNLDLSWREPDPVDTVYIAFDESAAVAYYPDLMHDFKLSNQNEDYAIALDIAGVPMDSTFTDKNMTMCMINPKATGDTVQIASAEGRIWQSNDTTYMTANVLGFDSVLYDIELWYAVPTPTKTVVLDITNATFYNKLEEEGFFALIGTTEDKSTEFAISLLGNTEEDIAGTYINDGIFGEFTGKNYDFLNYIFSECATYIATNWNEEKGDYDKIMTIEKGQAKVTKDAENNVTLVGSFISKDSIQYEITLTTQVDIPRLDDDMTEGAIDCVITGNDITLEDYTEENGSIFFDVLTDKELMALYFFAEKSDPEIVIPEGTYYIDESQDYYTVNASDGTIGTYPSFYATHNGQDFTSMYFFVSGTVEVSKKNGKLYMEINARNSYNIPAHIIYDGSTTDVENIQAEDTMGSQKRIIDGQLMIIRNGKTYNIMGTQVN